MKKIDNWSNKKLCYILYQDKYFLKNIYAQIYNDFPDIGQIAYIGTNTKRLTKDYSLSGEDFDGKDLNKNMEINKKDYNKNISKNNTKHAGIRVCDDDEESKICEYANIHEIKEMNNMVFYKTLLGKVIDASKSIKEICHITGKICMYDKYSESEDVFVKIDNACVWLKRSFMDTTAINMANILSNVNLVGYTLEEKEGTHPKVIKAIAIYI